MAHIPGRLRQLDHRKLRRVLQENTLQVSGCPPTKRRLGRETPWNPRYPFTPPHRPRRNPDRMDKRRNPKILRWRREIYLQQDQPLYADERYDLPPRPTSPNTNVTFTKKSTPFLTRHLTIPVNTGTVPRR